RLLLLGGEVVGAASVREGLGVDTRLLAAVDGGEYHAGAVVVEHGAREREPSTDILKRVVAQQRHMANAALDQPLLLLVRLVERPHRLLQAIDLLGLSVQHATQRIIQPDGPAGLTTLAAAPRREDGEQDAEQADTERDQHQQRERLVREGQSVSRGSRKRPSTCGFRWGFLSIRWGPSWTNEPLPGCSTTSRPARRPSPTPSRRCGRSRTRA